MVMGTMIQGTTVKRDAFGIARFIADYKTTEQRRQEGKALRAKIPRESHAEFEMAKDRTDPVKVIKKSSEGRLQHLIPIRYGRMAKSVFAFYRGTASLMAMDLGTHPDIRYPGPGLRGLPPLQFRSVCHP